jgi:hypothetical protein
VDWGSDADVGARHRNALRNPMATADFYHSGGFMVGVDEHPYVPTSNTEEPTPHIVAAALADGDKLLPEIYADGHHMINQASKVTSIKMVHIPLTKKPPGSKEAVTFIQIVMNGKSSAEHATPTVFAHSIPLAICFVWCVGVNENCGTKPYNNAVINPCTVVTHAVIDDQVRNAIKSWVKQLVDWLKGLLKEYLKKAATEAIRKIPYVGWLLAPLTKPIVDWVVDKAVDLADTALNTAENLAKLVLKGLGDTGSNSLPSGGGGK